MAIKKAYKELSEKSVKDLVSERMDKYANMGVYKG
jgi:acetyl-CoA carboxylase alpha subunit